MYNKCIILKSTVQTPDVNLTNLQLVVLGECNIVQAFEVNSFLASFCQNGEIMLPSHALTIKVNTSWQLESCT